VRAVALIGVVAMNFHGYLLLRGGEVGDGFVAELFDPWNGALSTRFAATFVLVAGVGVTLMTRRVVAAGDRGAIRAARWRLVRRGLFLYGVGLLVDEVWPGTILPYYGAMFMLAALLFTLRTRWIVTVGVGAAVAGSALRLWLSERRRNGADVGWLTDPTPGSPADRLFGVFVNGTHPLLPWLAILCAGIVLGRVLDTSWWRRAAIAGGLATTAVAWIAATADGSPTVDAALSTRPFDGGILYITSIIATALVAYGTIDWLAERFPTATDPLRRAGQLTLSIYLAHVLVFKVLVDWLNWIDPAGLDVALALSAGFWIVAIVGAVWWQRRFGIGPAERLYRAVGG
jgi:uncharacterized membrane protein YeiB